MYVVQGCVYVVHGSAYVIHSAVMDDNREVPELPSGIALAWGVTERPRRGPRPGLSIERIVECAIELADAEGLAALSMSRLATELGFTTMSLYRYVASKDELLVLVADAAVGPPPAIPTSDWRAGLATWVREQITVIRAHPWWVHIPITGPPLNPNSVAWIETGLQVMAGSGLRETEKMGIIQLLAGYVLNQGRIEVEITRAYAEAGITDPSSVGRDYGRALSRLIDAVRFPALTAALAENVFDDDDQDWDVEVEFGLQRILDGIEVLISSRHQAAE